ncbi:ATP-binding cassette domain-containing protein [Sulfitobacter albidus]|uniref:ATP-binding cassette domain-containing protein n=1 Tax=Sulfitobacter albidus TaxID=2829501 RepID=A0A975JB79_9RHOB|nr:ATP-binding cassette domain-containing protein [Sulfitobacter albidus]QUJ75284.1 ATP-binding cassette domain-containing protein [Sulfitobacter albidus]
MTELVLEFEGLRCGYADTEILHGVSGSLKQGQTLGLFGRNGVGKTTLCRALTGALPLLSGEIKLGGQPLDRQPAFARRRKGISYMPQTGMVFDNLSVRENLSLARSDLQVAPYFERFPRLAERLDQLAGSMSGGERKILSFVRVMLEESVVAILDEPSEGVQPENIENMQQCMLEKQKLGCSFILVEQNVNMLMTASDALLGLDSGRTVYEADGPNFDRDEIVSVLTV